jgi:hypothetical protein
LPNFLYGLSLKLKLFVKLNLFQLLLTNQNKIPK